MWLFDEDFVEIILVLCRDVSDRFIHSCSYVKVTEYFISEWVFIYVSISRVINYLVLPHTTFGCDWPIYLKLFMFLRR